LLLRGRVSFCLFESTKRDDALGALAQNLNDFDRLDDLIILVLKILLRQQCSRL